MKKFLSIILLFFCSIVYAEVYQHTDARGNIIYSDIPMNNKAAMVALPEVNQVKTTIAPPPTRPAEDTRNKVAIPTSKPYLIFFIESPKNGETIQNQPVIPIKMRIEPELQPQDSIQLILDGKLSGAPRSSTQFELTNPDRGTHQLSAYVIGANQEMLNQSNVVTIYVHHASIFTIKNTGGRAPTAPAAPTTFPGP